ncbi:hypothetical protein KC19_VG213600 [Ceratodon purpureus]|uniref:Endonuclease/exonuclease/phosphatase domain-containing protein n=1 Tax=Ceratodon purpureus TaxID=3225 RepID=A0A8T0HSM5_CERPU|nr:hypothetical protein KC19_VG213600 [Ceratodon purpureus]
MEFMRLNLLSSNARSLNDPTAVDSLKLYIQDCQPTLDIIFIQEHKRRGEALLQLGPPLWRQATSYGLDASPAYGNEDDDPGAGCGGTISKLSPRLAHAVSATGQLFDNRVHSLILSSRPVGDLGIANVYAHNSSSERCHLWEAMARELPPHCRWLLLGDLNMVESK